MIKFVFPPELGAFSPFILERHEIISFIKNQKISLMNKRIITLVAVVIAIVLLFVFLPKSNDEQLTVLSAKVKQGDFECVVTVSGELLAENSVKVKLPNELLSGRSYVYSIKITDMVEEGTYVDSGDYVASLDHSAIQEQIDERQESLDLKLEDLIETKMDTNFILINIRNELVTLKDRVEEKELILGQSIYESPAIQRQAEIDLERAKRELDQEKRNYELQKVKAEQRLSQLNYSIRRTQRELEDFHKIFESLNIKAERPGIIIYRRDRTGSKIQVGSIVDRYHPEIAELPDLSSMISRTYVNEVDISKIMEGQPVTVGIDAFPDIFFTGEVINVSNIGQSVPGKNTKVFEVDVRIFEQDELLRPSMTTSNAILTSKTEDALYIPLDALYVQDSINYVFLSRQNVKQVVVPGDANENHVVIKKGLKKGQRILLNPPHDEADLPLTGEDILKDELSEKAKE